MLGREQELATIRIDEDDRVAPNSARDQSRRGEHGPCDEVGGIGIRALTSSSSIQMRQTHTGTPKRQVPAHSVWACVKSRAQRQCPLANRAER